MDSRHYSNSVLTADQFGTLLLLSPYLLRTVGMGVDNLNLTFCFKNVTIFIEDLSIIHSFLEAILQFYYHEYYILCKSLQGMSHLAIYLFKAHALPGVFIGCDSCFNIYIPQHLLFFKVSTS